MCNRVPIVAWRSIRTSLNVNYTRYGQVNRSIVIITSKYSTIPVSCQGNLLNERYKLVSNTKMGHEYSTEASQITIPVVSYEEVKDLPNQPKKMLIDVREPSELQETGIIPTAINIPLGEVHTALEMSDRQFKTKYNRNKPNLSDEIIFHCKIGRRSENAAIAATKLGYTNAKNYVGSWLDWAEREGLPK